MSVKFLLVILLIFILQQSSLIRNVICTSDIKDTSHTLRIGQDFVYQPNNGYVLTLETNPQATSDFESLRLKFRTRQKDNSVLAFGRTNEHSFKIELVDGRLVFQFTDDTYLTISSYSLPAKNLNNGEWHELIVHRKKSKFEIIIDEMKYSEVSFNKMLTENVFAGGRITLGFNYDLNQVTRYNGEISEIVISVDNVPLKIKEFPIAYNEIYPGVDFSEHSNGIDKVIIRVDMAPGASVSFRQNDPPITLSFTDEKHVDSFGVSFRTSTDGIVASLVGKKSKRIIGLEVVKQQLFITVQNGKKTERKGLGAVKYNFEHTVYLRNDRQGDVEVISARLTSNRQSSVSFRVSDPFLIEKISFGGEPIYSVFVNSRPITGCISKPYLNLYTLNLKPLIGVGRSDCSYQEELKSDHQRSMIDHVEGITFSYGDRPLPFTYAENDRREFKSLELDFATLASSGIITSLHDTGDNFIALYIKNGMLYLTIDDKNIEQQSFAVSDKLVNDGQYHRIRIVNSENFDDYAELDNRKTVFPQRLTDKFFLTTVYFAAADFWAKDHYSLGSEGNFFGCMRHVLFNGEYIIRYDHVIDKNRINAKCQPVVKKPVLSVAYLKPDVSFSCKKSQDALNIKLSNSEEFNSLAIPLSTFVNDGIIASLSSTFDLKTIILYVQSGGLNLAYMDDTGKELHLTTGKLINDGNQHKVILKRVLGRILLNVNDQSYNIDLPIGSNPLFFDKLVVGGAGQSTRFVPLGQSNLYQGCFHHIEYNKASVIPSNEIPIERQQCAIYDNKVCDAENNFCNHNFQSRGIPHETKHPDIIKFCSSGQCSVFCQPNEQSIVSINRPIMSSLHQRISILLRTNDRDAEVFRTKGVTGITISICSKNGFPVMNIENDGRVSILEFPKQRIDDANHHIITIKRYQNQINLTIDGQTSVHTIPSFRKKKITFDHHTICSGHYQGYIQDVTFSTDSEDLDILSEIVQNPVLAKVGTSAIWENRYSIQKRDTLANEMMSCNALNCGRDKLECRLKRSEVNINVNIGNKMCICVDANGPFDSICEPRREDPCSTLLCLNGNCVEDNGRAVCQCNTGYIGEHCDLQADICLKNPCQNDGTCYPQGTSSFICYCTSEYTGHYCEIPVRQVVVDPCQHVRCLNGGECNGGRCNCPDSYAGDYCELLDPCKFVTCENNGQCIQGRCSCSPPFTGSYCEIMDPCHGVVCANNGRCENGQCRCMPGYYGSYCNEIDDCHNVECFNNGVCENGRCRCRGGYMGDKCEIFDACKEVVCLHGGYCNNGRCECPANRIGSSCEIEEKDPCDNINCLNNGMCKDGKCECLSGYFGSQCEQKDLCSNVNCHDGKCVDGKCVCLQGFLGQFCESFDLCNSVTCLNNGNCLKGNCDCPLGFTGSDCSTRDLCYGVSCLHGHCVNGNCECDSGYYGADCQLINTHSLLAIDKPQGGLIEYGELPRVRGKHFGAIFAIASGLLLGALAGAFAARKCAEGAYAPATAVTTIPVINSNSAHPIATMMDRTVPTVFAGVDTTVTSSKAAASMFETNRTEDEQLLLPGINERGDVGAAMSDGGQTERIETIHERTIEKDYGLHDAGMYAGMPLLGSIVAAPYATYGDFYSPLPQHTERLVEAQLFNDGSGMSGGASFAYHPPPIGDFGYGPSGHVSQQIGYSDAESWDASGHAIGTTSGVGPNSLQMNTLAAGVDYELSNINTLAMTPNGKYAIVGQSQGPPQIWDAQNGNLINSLYGNCNNCTQLALACNGSLLVGLSSDATDTQPCIVQIWDINTGRSIHLSHQIKCSAFTLSNNTNNIVMAGNQKYGRGISVGILDLVSNELTKELKSDTQTNLGRDPSFIALTPDECHAVIGCYNQTQAMTNYVVFDLTVSVDIVQPPCISLDCDPKRCVVLNNRECISGLNNGQVFVWDLHTCKPVHYFSDSNLDRTAHRSQVKDVKLSIDKTLLITTSKDGTAKIWDTVGRNLLTRLLGHHSEVICACFASNQLLAVTGSIDQNICLWRLPSGQLAAQMNIGMIPTEVHMASQNRTVVAIAEKDNERQLLMLKVVSSALAQSSSQR